MNYKKKGFWVGVFAGITGITAYWITQAMAYSEVTCAALAAAAAGTVSFCCETVWECEQKKRHRKAIKRAVNKAIERFMAETEQDYLVIPRESYEAVHRHRRWETEDEPEEHKQPIREVKGALAEDFAKAPEEVKHEIFG